MKTSIKATLYGLALLICCATYGFVGYSSGLASAEPVVETVYVEVPIEVKVEKSYEVTVLFGVTGDLREVELELGYNPDDYLVVLELRYNPSDSEYSFARVQLVIDLGDIGQLSKPITIPSNDFEIRVVKGSAALDLPDPVEGEEF